MGLLVVFRGLWLKFSAYEGFALRSVVDFALSEVRVCFDVDKTFRFL